MVANLIFSGRDRRAPPFKMSPWLDMRIFRLEHVLTQLEQQTHRRFIKTHLPLDGLRFDQRVKYLYVGRDTRDVFMSWWNHYRSFTEGAFILFSTAPGRVGPELPRCPDDIHDYWRIFMTRGWFDWESDGYPANSPLHHAQSWWDYRHLPNFFLYTTRTSWRIFKRRLSASRTFLKSRFRRRCGRQSSETARFRR
jgi:aryl sulfotransferase